MNEKSSNLGYKKQRRFIIYSVSGIAVIVLAALVFVIVSQFYSKLTSEIKVGMKAPDFQLDAARGGKYSLKSQEGKAVLISFLYTQAEATSEEAKPSRNQVIFLRSMEKQYSSKGMRVLIVDASYMETNKKVDWDKLINYTYDWRLDTIPVLADSRSINTAGKYGVKKLPTTFLINKDGFITQRWDGFASSPQLALGIEAVVGEPDYRENTVDSKEEAYPQEVTPAQAKFQGILPARPLSDNIWLCDGGKAWAKNGQYPIKWVIISNEKADFSIKAMAVNLKTGERTVITDGKLQLIPENEAKVILANTSDSSQKVYMLDKAIELSEAGYYNIDALVTKNGETHATYMGQAIIFVK